MEPDPLDAMPMLLTYVVDSFEKLEVIVHLFRIGEPQGALAIGRAARLSPRTTAEVLSDLLGTGIVHTNSDDDARWWFAIDSPWTTSVEMLVELYDSDLVDLLAFMRDAALHGLRRQGFYLTPTRPGRRRLRAN